MNNKLVSIAKERMNVLFEQPHDNEWDSPYDEFEYFILKKITQNVYSENTDSFIENPIVTNISNYNIIKYLEDIDFNLLNEKITLLDIDDEYELFFKSILIDFIDTYSWSISPDSFNYIAMHDVLKQAIIPFFKNYEKENYDPTDTPYDSFFIIIEKENNNQYSESSVPLVDEGVGWVRSLIFNKILRKKYYSFSYWDGSNFLISENEKIADDLFEVIAWAEICKDKDEEHYLLYSKYHFEIKEQLKYAFSETATEFLNPKEIHIQEWKQKFKELKII